MPSANEEAQKLKAIMERHGVRASVEVQIGRPWSGDRWYSAKHVLINHHTAGSSTGLTPSLALVKRGRGADLPGPLCNGYGGRDHVYRIICMGLANHPGKGGPLTVAGWSIPKDSARISTWGTEWEHDGVSPWPADMREFMGRANAALCEFWSIGPNRSIEHSTWAPNRKIDRNGYTAGTGQAEIRLWQNTTKPSTQEDDDMAGFDPKDVWRARHELTAPDCRAYGIPEEQAGKTTKSYDEIVRFPPGVARLRRETADGLDQVVKAVKALTDGQAALLKAIGAIDTGSADDVREALTEGTGQIIEQLGKLQLRLAIADDTPDE